MRREIVLTEAEQIEGLGHFKEKLRGMWVEAKPVLKSLSMGNGHPRKTQAVGDFFLEADNLFNPQKNPNGIFNIKDVENLLIIGADLGFGKGQDITKF